MVAAIEAVKAGATVKRAALEHGVPRSTLNDCISGRVVHCTKPGPRPYLSPHEESNLSEFLQAVGQVGYPKTRREVKSIAESVAREKGVLKGFASSWRGNHSCLCARKTQLPKYVWMLWPNTMILITISRF